MIYGLRIDGLIILIGLDYIQIGSDWVDDILIVETFE